MLPTFVIGLREGLEAALIVGIIAAFLRKQGRSDLLRWVAIGVGTAILLCLGVGAALEVASRDLPQRQQEGLETVVGALAVAMVTYMVVWMRRHSRELKGSLEGAAAAAIESGATRAGRALVVMAFLAVLREGFETVVFLLAAFNESGNGAPAVAGALLGIAVAIGLGWAIYRGGVRLNLSKFFRATGIVLVLVAAGLVVSGLHTAHEAGWLNIGQGSTVDLSWLVRAGSVQASLLTGMLGVQDRPVVIEVIGWLAYLVPVGAYVAWPPGRSISPRRVATVAGIAGLSAAAAALVLVAVAPSSPARQPVTTAGATTMKVLSHNGSTLMLQMQTADSAATVALQRVGVRDAGGVDYYSTAQRQPVTTGRPTALGLTAVARFNGGRLPLGLTTTNRPRIPVTYVDVRAVSVGIEPRTSRVVAARWSRQVTATLHATIGAVALDRPVLHQVHGLSASAATAARASAGRDVAQLDRRADRRDLAAVMAVLAALLILAAAGFGTASRRRTSMDTAAPGLIGHQVSLT